MPLLLSLLAKKTPPQTFANMNFMMLIYFLCDVISSQKITSTLLWWYSCDVIPTLNFIVMLFWLFLRDVNFCDDIIHPLFKCWLTIWRGPLLRYWKYWVFSSIILILIDIKKNPTVINPLNFRNYGVLTCIIVLLKNRKSNIEKVDVIDMWSLFEGGR